MIRVLLVEPNRLMRGGLASLLGGEEDIEVIGEAGGNGNVMARALSYRPDVIVIDVDSEQGEELAAAGELSAKLPECRLLLVTDLPTVEHLRRVLSLRAPGVISTNAPPDRLVHGVRKLVRGQRFVDPELALVALEAADNPLTSREQQVLRLAAAGVPTRDVACQLSLAVGTVRNHLSAITTKIGARNRIDAIRIARESGWL